MAKIGTRTFAVAVFDATLVIVTCNMFFFVMAKDHRHGYFYENLTFFKIRQQDILINRSYCNKADDEAGERKRQRLEVDLSVINK